MFDLLFIQFSLSGFLGVLAFDIRRGSDRRQWSCDWLFIAAA